MVDQKEDAQPGLLHPLPDVNAGMMFARVMRYGTMIVIFARNVPVLRALNHHPEHGHLRFASLSYAALGFAGLSYASLCVVILSVRGGKAK